MEAKMCEFNEAVPAVKADGRLTDHLDLAAWQVEGLQSRYAAQAEQVAARLALFQKAEANRYGGDAEWAARYEDEAHDMASSVAWLLEVLGVAVPTEVTDEVVQEAFA